MTASPSRRGAQRRGIPGKATLRSPWPHLRHGEACSDAAVQRWPRCACHGPIPVTARSAAMRQSMDRCVPRHGPIPVTARSVATRQSMDRCVPRHGPIPVTARSAATRQSRVRCVPRHGRSRIGARSAWPAITNTSANPSQAHEIHGLFKDSSATSGWLGRTVGIFFQGFACHERQHPH